MTIRIVFMGSPDFAVPVLRALAANDTYQVIGVVTQPDRPSGRHMNLAPPPVKVAADELHIPVIQPQKLREPGAVQQLKDWNPDLIVVAAFGQILRPEVLELPKYGCVNVHASLLPRHRGATPIQAAILAGDSETGITIMKMDPGLDTGPMLRQRAIPIGPQDTGGSLFEKLSQLSSELLLETLPEYISGKLLPQPQPETGSTYAPMLKKEHGLLDFTRPAIELERQIRAFTPWPGSFLLQDDGAPLKIHKAHVVAMTPAPWTVRAPRSVRGAGDRLAGGARETDTGKRVVFDGLPAIGTADGLIVFDELQPAGKKPMPGKAFLAGGRTW